MYQRSWYWAAFWTIAVAGLTSLGNGCARSGSVEARAFEDGLTPGHPIEGPYELHTMLRARTEPAGAEIWVGPGCATPTGSPGGLGAGGRFVGRSPLFAKLTIHDLSPSGDLEFSIRDGGTVLRNGRIQNAEKLMRQKGRFRIDVNLLQPVEGTKAAPSRQESEEKAGS